MTAPAPEALPTWVGAAALTVLGTADWLCYYGEPWIEEDEVEFRTALAATIAAAERRGAEAMRERCAEVADTGTENPQWISADIRTRPLPGDKT